MIETGGGPPIKSKCRANRRTAHHRASRRIGVATILPAAGVFSLRGTAVTSVAAFSHSPFLQKNGAGGETAGADGVVGGHAGLPRLSEKIKENIIKTIDFEESHVFFFFFFHMFLLLNFKK